jgi:ornithine cyclodeaminase
MHRTALVKMLILSESNVRQCLSMKQCLDASRQAFISLAQGTATVPTRIGLPYYNPDKKQADSTEEDWTLFKPASTAVRQTSSSKEDDDEQEVAAVLMGCKIVSVRAQNPAANLPLVPASIVSLNAKTGQVDALVAATYLTGARTAAGSALATQVAFEGRTLEHLVLFGAGLQAELHVEAIATALPQDSFAKITIINRSAPRAVALKEHLLTASSALYTAKDVQVVLLNDTASVSHAVGTACCIVTATNTKTPLFAAHELPAGCHVNGIGSYTPAMKEVDIANQCRVWIDTPEARTVGDLKDLPETHPVQLLGHVLLAADDDSKRKDVDDSKLPCTFYKAVGTAIQDVLTANVVVKRARALGIGTEVDMS